VIRCRVAFDEWPQLRCRFLCINPAIARYGGRYLVRGGAASVIEGDPPPETIIVVEFPTMERLREWYVSPE
jgi:uncharacterized protein (DUF1330 family)